MTDILDDDIAVIVKLKDGSTHVVDFLDGDDHLEPMVRLRGLNKAIRAILHVPEGESVLTHAAMIYRQWNDMKKMQGAQKKE